MRTLHSLPEGDLLIAGRLAFVRSGPRKRPGLRLEYLDPIAHARRWVDVPATSEYRPETVVETQVLDPLAPGGLRAAWVVHDPAEARSARATLAHFEARFRSWVMEMHFAGVRP